MRNISLLFALFVICITDGKTQSKIGFIDFQYLITQVQSIEDVQQELEKLSKDWTADIEEMQDSVTQLENDLETLSLTLTKSGRQVVEKNIADSKKKIVLFQEQKFSPATGELYKKQQELLQPIIDKIKRAVDNVRIRERYDVIFDISTGNPVSIDKKSDLTSLVVDEFSVVGLTAKQQAAEAGANVRTVKNKEEGVAPGQKTPPKEQPKPKVPPKEETKVEIDE